MLNCWNDDHADKPYPWERHSGWTMPEIRQQFPREQGDGLRIISIQNQNPRLMRNWREYAWLKTALERDDPYYAKRKLAVVVQPALHERQARVGSRELLRD